MTTTRIYKNFHSILKAYIVQILLVVISIILVLSYESLPTKRLEIIPFPVASTGVYSDAVNGGNSSSEWKPDINAEAFSCTLREGINYPFCGMIFNFNFGKYQSQSDSIDLTQFDSIDVNLRASDKVTAVRINIRNLNDLYYSINDINSTMFMSTMLTSNDLNKNISIDLNQFRVAQWWLEQYNVPRQHWSPSMDKIRTFAVEITFENEYQIEHTVEIKNIAFVGKVINRANWYLTIMGLWGLYAFYYLINSTRKFIQQSKRDQALVEHLKKAHKILQDEHDTQKQNSLFDPLTKAYNRRGFEDKLTAIDALNLAQGSENDQNAIIFIDLDNFKLFNEDYSHEVGDQLLKELIDIISSEVRDDDIIARWGRDEFIMFCPKASSIQGFAIAEKIRIIIEKHLFCKPHNLKATASFGVASCSSMQQFKASLHNADEALFKAKRDGKNQSMIAD